MRCCGIFWFSIVNFFNLFKFIYFKSFCSSQIINSDWEFVAKIFFIVPSNESYWINIWTGFQIPFVFILWVSFGCIFENNSTKLEENFEDIWVIWLVKKKINSTLIKAKAVNLFEFKLEINNISTLSSHLSCIFVEFFAILGFFGSDDFM